MLLAIAIRCRCLGKDDKLEKCHSGEENQYHIPATQHACSLPKLCVISLRQLLDETVCIGRYACFSYKLQLFFFRQGLLCADKSFRNILCDRALEQSGLLLHKPEIAP